MGLPQPTTIEAALLVEELERRGIKLRVVEGGKLRCRPQSLLSDRDKERLKLHKAELLSALGYAGEFAPATPATPATQTGNAHTYGDSAGGTMSGTPAPGLPPQARRQAEALGLVARWSHEFSYISIHDPTSGDWYDLPAKDAPKWAKTECFKRRELRKRGERRMLNREEIEAIYAQEVAHEVTHRAVTRHGIMYEDYLNEEDV